FTTLFRSSVHTPGATINQDAARVVMRGTRRPRASGKGFTNRRTSAELSTPAASTANMTLGSLLATANASAAAAPVMPMAAPSMIGRTRPSTREVPVPSASHTVVRATDLPDMGAIVLSALRFGGGATVRLARHGADARVATAAADRPPHAG